MNFLSIETLEEGIDFIHILEHSLLHTISLLPFLLLVYLLIELIAHKFSNKHKILIVKSGKVGPLFGGLFGLIPQCGFGVMATNLYASRIITLGTLIAIFLTTSDEMLPILISSNVEFSLILEILSIKFFIGLIVGFIIDFILRKKQVLEVGDITHEHPYHCPKGIVKSVVKHILHTLAFIFFIYFTLELIYALGFEEYLEKLLMTNTILSPFVAALIGLIPSCAASVMITQLYLLEAISFGTMIAGLLANSGLSLVVLFKINKDLKMNLTILGIIYIIGVVSGLIINCIL